jgi:hypothetical protein
MVAVPHRKTRAGLPHHACHLGGVRLGRLEEVLDLASRATAVGQWPPVRVTPESTIIVQSFKIL